MGLLADAILPFRIALFAAVDALALSIACGPAGLRLHRREQL